MFIMTEEQKEMVSLAKKFAENEVKPYSQQMDEEMKFIPGLVQKLADIGFMGINVPEEYGGTGMDDVTKSL